MLFALDLHEDFIDAEGIAVAMILSLQSPGEPGTELDTPEPNGFVGDCDASLSKQIFDITVAEVESAVKPDCIADDLRWEPVTFVDIHSGIIHFRELSCQYDQMKVARCPAYRDLAGCNFAESAVDQTLVKSLHAGDFIDDAHHVVFIGGRGTGKTHLATAIGVHAIRHLHLRVRCFSTIELVNLLEREKADGKPGQM